MKGNVDSGTVNAGFGETGKSRAGESEAVAYFNRRGRHFRGLSRNSRNIHISLFYDFPIDPSSRTDRRLNSFIRRLRERPRDRKVERSWNHLSFSPISRPKLFCRRRRRSRPCWEPACWPAWRRFGSRPSAGAPSNGRCSGRLDPLPRSRNRPGNDSRVFVAALGKERR